MAPSSTVVQSWAKTFLLTEPPSCGPESIVVSVPGRLSGRRNGKDTTVTNKTPREEAIQKEQERKDEEKEHLEEEEERRLK
ncbi:hypothetical protein GCM10027406_30840 [Leifsonia lichenia]